MNDTLAKNLYIYLKVEKLILGFSEDSNYLSFAYFVINNDPLEKTIIIHGSIQETNPSNSPLTYKIRKECSEEIEKGYSFNSFHFQLNIYGEDKKKNDSLGHINFHDFSKLPSVDYDKCIGIECFY